MGSLFSSLLLWHLAFRNVFRHYSRTIATLSAISFGCFSILFAGGFFEDVFRKMRESSINTQTGHIQIYQDGYLANKATNPFDYMIEDPNRTIKKIERFPEVYSVAQRTQTSGLISVGENNSGILILGVEPEKDKVTALDQAEKFRPRKMSDRDFGWTVLTKGRNLQKGDNAFEAMIGKGLAESLNISIGDTIVVLTNTVSGSINALDLEVVGEFFTSIKELDDRTVRISIPTSKTLLASDSIQSLIVRLHKTEDTMGFKGTLARLFEQDNLNYEMETWENTLDFYFKTKAMFGSFFIVILIIIGVIITLSIFNTMSMSVLERTVEIGTIRAMGASSRTIKKIFLREGFIIGLMGGVIGACVGSLLVYLIAVIGITMPPPPGASMHWLAEPAVIPQNIAIVFILSIATSVFAAIIPAGRAARMQIADSLRHVL